MARFVFATHAAGSHIAPLVPVARELRGRGHEVAWYTGAAYRGQVERSGATFAAPRHGRFINFERLELDFPAIVDMPPIARTAWFLETVWAEPCAGQYRDLRELCDTGDVLLADSGLWAANLLHETDEVTWATICQAPMSLPGPDVPPYGKGWHPRPPGSRRRDDIAGPRMFQAVLGPATARVNGFRADLGLAPRRGQLVTPYLYMQATVPAFEYPRPGLPPHAHFIGPLIPEPPDTPRPGWIDELDRSRPVVLISQGTMSNRTDMLIEPAVEALAGGSEQVVVAGIDGMPGPQPGDVRAMPFVPYGHLMPRVDAVVTSGGYGTVHQALAHGVPLVVSGRTDDKPETCARVSWCGAGIDLRAQRPSPRRLRAAVDAVLGDARFAHAARRMATEFARYDAPRTATKLLERLAADRAPVTAG